MITIIAYIALGVMGDILIARYYRSISDRRALSASIYALLIPLLTFGVMERALNTHDLRCIIGFVLGNGLGTYWAVRHG
jgi:hypothetical protein